jgi:integrase
MKNLLKEKCYRDYVLFLIGINTGIKICDLLSLKFSDVLDCSAIKDKITVKNKVYRINRSVSEAITEYISLIPSENLGNRYLFEKNVGSEPIGRSHAYRIINNAAREVGITQKIGTHTLRKTYGFHHYMKYNDVTTL